MSTKYQVYSEYKDSGVDWLGNIPEHWKIASLSKLFDIKAGGDLKTEFFSEDQTDEHPYPIYTNANDVNAIYGYTSKFNYSPNTITVSGRGEVGFAVYRDHAYDAIIRLLVLAPTGNSNCKFFSYFINEVIDFRVESSAIGQLSTQQISPYKVSFPFFDEQEQIANFLDHETAKIDTLIEKQQQLIKLLKEKRQAVISDAVTKGLNPTNSSGTNLNSGFIAGPQGEGMDSPSSPPMRDSGVEWLGEVPEHWAIKRFKFLCDRIIAGPFGSSITKDMYVKHGFKVYGQEQVIPNDFSIGDYYISEKDYLELARYIVASEDILISCVGTFGKIAVFPEGAEQGIINPRLIKAELNEGCNPYYVRELLKSEMVFKQFELLSRGGTMGVINIAILNEILAAVPPLNEQGEIVGYIKEQKGRFRDLIQHANNAVTLLTERRTALISAAVTGKIDVRHHALHPTGSANTAMDENNDL